jgi:hypothetical protein
MVRVVESGNLFARSQIMSCVVKEIIKAIYFDALIRDASSVVSNRRQKTTL